MNVGTFNVPTTDPETQFIQQWGLGEDAQRKLWDLTDAMRELVMNEFHPKGTAGADVTGKFIMFAASIEKAHGSFGASSSGAGKGAGVLSPGQGGFQVAKRRNLTAIAVS